jgi:FkbM family methyltransferase
VAVEPQEACAAILEAKFGGNPSVTVVRKALDSVETTRRLHVDNASTLSSMSPEWIDRVKASGRFPSQQWDHTVDIATTTLDKLIGEFGRPVFCKIDVEGFESNVLKGLTQPIRYISFEFVPEYLESTRECIEHLDKIGPARFNYSEGESMELTLQRWLSKDEFYPVIDRLPKDGKWFGDIYVEFVA